MGEGVQSPTPGLRFPRVFLLVETCHVRGSGWITEVDPTTAVMLILESPPSKGGHGRWEAVSVSQIRGFHVNHRGQDGQPCAIKCVDMKNTDPEAPWHTSLCPVCSRANPRSLSSALLPFLLGEGSPTQNRLQKKRVAVF